MAARASLLSDEMAIHRATARNFSTETENRIHSDEVAAQFGFAGALVPGSAVFGHMTYPLVDTLGAGWLADFTADLRLFKPAYHGDELAIEYTRQDDEHTVRCHARGVLLAELLSRPLADGGERATNAATAAPATAPDERPEIHWDNVEVGVGFPLWTWAPDALANAEAAAQVEDDLACYREGVVHPHAILNAANRAFTRRYRLPAWIHVSSALRFHRQLRVGDRIEVRTVPSRKWQRKNYQFVDLEMAFAVDGNVATQITHTSIFHIGR